jgi:S1-C subfamily serine protease
VLATANAEGRPEYLEVKGRARINDTGSRPYFGIIPNLTSEAEGLAVANVAAGGPAAQAGVEAGDIIIRFVGTDIGGLSDFDKVLRKQAVGNTVEVSVKRGSDAIDLKVKLAQP